MAETEPWEDEDGEIRRYARTYLSHIGTILTEMRDGGFLDHLVKVARVLRHARDGENTLFTMGNGGSAATASHMVCDIAKGTIVPGRKRFKAICLADNVASVMAWANDSAYDDIFVEQLRNLMRPGDVVLGISGSGNSENVLRAIRWANEKGGITVGWSGFDGGKLARICAYSYTVPSHNMQRIEDIHMLMEHLLSSLLRDMDAGTFISERP